MAIRLTTSYQRISTIGLSYGEIRTYAKYSNQSIADNKTTYELKSTYYTSQNTLSFSSATGNLDGTTRSYGYTTMYKGETTISEVSRTITHNTDGSSPIKNVATSWTATFGGSGSTSADVDFPKINRYATITSAPDFNDEANPTINYSNPAGNSVTTLQAGIFSTDSQTAYAGYRDISKTGSSYTFNLTTAERNALRNAIPNSKTLQVKFYVRTIVSGSTFWSSIQKTMTIVNGNPTFTHSEVETNSVVSNALGSTSANTIVKNLSRVKFTVTPSAKKGASISKVELTQSGSTSSDTSSPYEFTITPTSNSFVIKATDSRGNSSSSTVTKTLLNYEPVKILSFSFKRNNPTGSNVILNLEATYWNTNIGSVTNAPVVKWKMNDGSQTTIPSSSVTIDNTNHKIKVTNYTVTDQLVYTTGARFYIYINDAYTSASNNIFVTKGIPILDLGDDEVAINGNLSFAENNNASILWKESGYGDKFRIIPDFNGSDDSNILRIQGTVGGAGTDPTNYANLLTISGKSGNTNISGITRSVNGFWSRATGEVGTPTNANSCLIIKRATNSEAPNNGVVLEFGNSTSWKGQLYIGDNATQGIYYNGWSNGTRGSWRRLADIPVTLYENSSGSTGTITLSETANNFVYIEIFYGKATGNSTGLASVKVPRAISSYANLICWANLTTVPQLLTKIVYINGTSISHQAGYYINFGTSSVSTGSNNEVKIYKVLGWRQ